MTRFALTCKTPKASCPRAAEVDQEKDKGLMSFAKILAENCSIHTAATCNAVLGHYPQWHPR
jgi:hypothetical protein